MSGVTTGLRGLDKLVTGLQLGDNVVWQIDTIEDYQHFVTPFVQQAIKDRKRIVYIRFAKHKPLLPAGKQVVTYKLDAYSGFETFSTRLNQIIGKEGEGVYYVFDCLSELLSAWATDLMIGNFFKITCPYLFVLNTIAYFGIIRNKHSFRTVARIREITQLLIDVYKYEDKYFVHPVKVWNRYSPTMFLPHIQKKEQFTPLTNSVDVAKLFSFLGTQGAKSARRNLDYWDLLFLRAEELTGAGTKEKDQAAMIDRLLKIMIARDERILGLARNNFLLEDLVKIKSRLIGTGFIGGKAVGMLLARKILAKNSPAWQKKLEPHDSFFIGSDVFYTYIVQNGWWKKRMEQKTREGYFPIAAQLRELLLTGDFNEEIKEQFHSMIEYFGQSPFIVRSSSLLEDAYGNAFAGKYESIFCANQGTPEERYKHFLETVKQVYASAMNIDALTYRWQRGLDQQDEQMALLVQRVSGSYHQKYFFPDMAGVGISYNTYIWKKEMDPQAGMLRLVFGLGTRAVNRVEGDYPRIVALDAPLLKPYTGMKNAQRFSQHEIDLINVAENTLQTRSINELLTEDPEINIERIGEPDEESIRRLKEMGQEDRHAWLITFDDLLKDTAFVNTMRQILKLLEAAYHYPVDIEFTVNFKGQTGFQVNLLQCRPHQSKGIGRKIVMPEDIKKEKIILAVQGSFVGGNISQDIQRIIYVQPEKYEALSQTEKYDIARLIGVINRQIKDREAMAVMLLGPGRWGTTTPSLGVPVSFSEINNMTVLGELSFISANAVPEISFGSHFFQDLVETGIFYMAIYPEHKGVIFDRALFKRLPNLLEKLAPEYKKYRDMVKVVDIQPLKARLMADIVSQQAVVFTGAGEK
ncbi:MAG: PEP/pyruvate-binding domain-containing protein [bacterium]|nr:PEP/pyruvate-binding domain-containing protein [bacterium]